MILALTASAIAAILLVAVGVCRLVRRARLARLLHDGPEPWCGRCGYSLFRLAGNQCPECGAHLTPETVRAAADFAGVPFVLRLATETAVVPAAIWLGMSGLQAWCYPAQWESEHFRSIGDIEVRIRNRGFRDAPEARRWAIFTASYYPDDARYPLTFDYERSEYTFDVPGRGPVRRIGNLATAVNHWLTDGGCVPSGSYRYPSSAADELEAFLAGRAPAIRQAPAQVGRRFVEPVFFRNPDTAPGEFHVLKHTLAAVGGALAAFGVVIARRLKNRRRTEVTGRAALAGLFPEQTARNSDTTALASQPIPSGE